MTRYKQTTKKGHDLYEVASALQKSIRRGLEDDAMYWMVELYESNYGEYCWKRLKIIASEDVGFAEPTAVVMIQSLYEMYIHQQKKTKATADGHRPERLFLTHATLFLARARKSRLVDWALKHFWNTHEYDNREIPEFALDKHTNRGRRKRRGDKHFFEEGSRLENHHPSDLEEEYKEKARMSISNPGPDLFKP